MVGNLFKQGCHQMQILSPDNSRTPNERRRNRPVRSVLTKHNKTLLLIKVKLQMNAVGLQPCKVPFCGLIFGDSSFRGSLLMGEFCVKK